MEVCVREIQKSYGSKTVRHRSLTEVKGKKQEASHDDCSGKT